MYASKFSALLALCVWYSPGIGEFPSQRPVTRSFDVFFDLCLNKQSCSWWFETPSLSLWRHCNDTSWRGHCMRMFSTLPVICDRNPPGTGVLMFSFSLVSTSSLTNSRNAAIKTPQRSCDVTVMWRICSLFPCRYVRHDNVKTFHKIWDKRTT